jgi:hypothetical protein
MKAHAQFNFNLENIILNIKRVHIKDEHMTKKYLYHEDNFLLLTRAYRKF